MVVALVRGQRNGFHESMGSSDRSSEKFSERQAIREELRVGFACAAMAPIIRVTVLAFSDESLLAETTSKTPPKMKVVRNT